MITFVSAYYTLQSTPYFNSHLEEWEPAPIFELARSGVQLCLYIGPTCAFETAFEELEKECPNFRVMPYRLYYKEMWIYHALKDWFGTTTIQMPASRNIEKDTLEYMVYMHSRHEIMEDAISENPWDSTHFAWIDFNSPRLFSKKTESFNKMKEIARYPFPDNAIYFAGFWTKLDADSVKNIANIIHWRFCGAFFLGDSKSFIQFANLYREYFPKYLKETGTFAWEVNFWAWLEYAAKDIWRPTWYRGDHNDEMLNIFAGVSADTYATPLNHCVNREDGGSKKIEYEYPKVEPFLPGSASYLAHGGKHYLNTRFVNYWMYPNGYYRFHTPDMVIENRNYLSELREDPDTLTLMPVDFREMDESVLYGLDGAPLIAPKREKRSFSVGLEDIRLFNGPGNRVRFIATNVEYSPGLKNRMILGTYDIATTSFRDCQVVVPPDANSWCEKNWIPVPFVNADGVEEERFIYKWSPMEIGRVDAATGQLQIVLRHNTNISAASWIFGRLRGSTTFIDCPSCVLPEGLRGGEGETQNTQYLVGLAHFSEEHSPRHYYHLLVLLEKGTLRPVRYSRVFYFEKLSIEFCIGMMLRGGIRTKDDGTKNDGTNGEDEPKYVFWISRFDRDPICMEVDCGVIGLDNVV